MRPGEAEGLNGEVLAPFTADDRRRIARLHRLALIGIRMSSMPEKVKAGRGDHILAVQKTEVAWHIGRHRDTTPTRQSSHVDRRYRMRQESDMVLLGHHPRHLSCLHRH